MSPEIAAHIFEPYFTTKPKDKGTGLGLSTVYGIVTAAGGTMTVDSGEGAGTAFHLYFPAAGAPSAAAPESASAAAGGNGETILVVDDVPAVLAVTARMLRRNGYATLEAATADQALHVAAIHDFQVLLTDSVMPGQSGQALADRVTRIRPGVAVVYMSGRDVSGSASDDPAEPPSVQKPFTQQTLLQAIQTALGTPRAPAARAARPGPGGAGA